jgi:iron-sulfur cluster assembly protein
MLELTDTAASVITALNEKRDLPEGAGIRIAPADDGSAHMTAMAASAPANGDQIVERDGARVFLDPIAANALGEKVLDAQVDQAGKVGFIVAQR